MANAVAAARGVPSGEWHFRIRPPMGIAALMQVDPPLGRPLFDESVRDGCSPMDMRRLSRHGGRHAGRDRAEGGHRAEDANRETAGRPGRGALPGGPPHEEFEDAARALFRLVHRTQDVNPGARRMLFLDIEGHRQADGRFDADMCEL